MDEQIGTLPRHLQQRIDSAMEDLSGVLRALTDAEEEETAAAETAATTTHVHYTPKPEHAAFVAWLQQRGFQMHPRSPHPAQNAGEDADA